MATATARPAPVNSLELLLRNRYRFYEELREGIDVAQKIRALLIYASLGLAIYGGVMGSVNSALQALASAAKLPLLFLATLLVCLPTLYFMTTIFEASLTLRQDLALMLTAITMTSVVLLAFSPVVLFFLLTTGHDDPGQYQFYKLLNVAIFTLAGWIGIQQLRLGVRMLTANDRRSARTRGRMLWLWILVYAFVGSQLAWTLRPFFGAPGLPFELFRGLGGNFYANIFASLGELFGFFVVK